LTLGVSDQVLVEELKRNDMKALGVIYLRYGGMVKSALLRFAPEMGAADVDEVCQDVFLALNESIERYEERMKFKNWLFGIAVKKARAWRRKTWLRRKLLDTKKGDITVTALPSNPSPDAALEHMEEVSRALSSLSSKQREVVMLYAADGMNCEEIAETLEIKVGVVWSRLHRARKVLMRHRELPEVTRVYQGEL